MIRDMIHYQRQGRETLVFLDGRIAGVIAPHRGGYHYRPRGAREQGEVFATVEEVKASLESE